MTWIKLDDKCPRHPKVAGLSDRAFRWWVQAMCYASEFLTDGALPVPFLKTVPAKVVAELITSGLWASDGSTTTIHDYLGHQTGRADVEKERARNRARRTGGVPAVRIRESFGQTPVVPPENRDQRTEGREQIQSTDPPPQIGGGGLAPRGGLIVPPKRWGLNHASCHPGFCDWMCLPAEDFGRFVGRLGEAKALAWAQSVRGSGVVPTGKPWTFWNAQFDAAHGSPSPAGGGGFSAAEWAAHMPGGAIDQRLGVKR